MTLIFKLIGTLVGSKSQSSPLAEFASQSKAELLSFQAEPTKWHSSTEDQPDSAINVNTINNKGAKPAKSTSNGKDDRKSSYQRKMATKLRLYLSSGGNSVTHQPLHQAALSTQSLTATQPNHYSNPKSLHQQQRPVPVNVNAQQQQQLPVECAQAAPDEQQISLQARFENAVPKPIQMLLNDLYLRGPQTEGIFRKSPNAKHCRELRQLLESALKECRSIMDNDIKLNSKHASKQHQRTTHMHQPIMSTKSFTANNNAATTTTTSRSANEYGLRQMLSAPSIQLSSRQQHLQQTISELQNSIEQYHVNVVASVFKEWLRSQNDCVLMSCLYAQWIDAAKLIEPISGLPTRALPEPEALALQLYEQQQHQCHQQQRSASSDNDSQVDRWPKTMNDHQDHYASSSGNSSHNEEDNISGDVPALRSSTTTTTKNLEANASNGKQPSNNNNNANDGDRNNTNSSAVVAAQSDNGRTTTTDLNLADKQRLWWLAERRQECLRVVRQLLATINEQNLLLLRAIICVLSRISAQSDCNKMSNQNLGVCVGQSLLYLPSESAKNSTTNSTLNSSSSAAARRVAAMRTATAPNLAAKASAGTHSKRTRRALRTGQSPHLLSSDQQLHQFGGPGHTNESGHHHSLLGLSLSSGAAPLPLPATNGHGAGLGHKISSAAASTFSGKRHRRARSQSLLASTLSLSSLSSLQLHSSVGAGGANNGGAGNGKGSPAGLAHAISQHQLSGSSALQTGTYLEVSGAQETAKYVPMLVAFMIDHASALFGQESVLMPSSTSASAAHQHKLSGDDSSATTVVVVEAARRAGNELNSANNNTSAAHAATNIATATATAINRPQPRMAHIRPNQFNGLYVRNASNSGITQAPAIVKVSSGANMHHLYHLHHLHQQHQHHQQQYLRPMSVNGNGLLIHQHQAPAVVRVVPNVVMTHHGHGHNHHLHQPLHRHQYSKNSNHSSTEQSLSSAVSSADESDESFIGECMESTMV